MPGRLSKKLGFDKATRFLVHKHLKWSMATVFLIFILIIALGYWFKWDWTGLNAHVGPNVQQYQSGKTLWDWMSVLCIPVAIAFGSLWFTAQQSKTQDAENEDNQRERALQDYIDKISDLLLQHNLRGSSLSIDSDLVIKKSSNEEVRTIARAQTLTVLARLDSNRKRSVLQFLHESGLIQKENPIVSLDGTDLTKANLSGANLFDAKLSGANLMGADLFLACLSDANLSGANLSGANLFDANLIGAKLIGAKLMGTNLSDADLNYANLFLANLSGANLSGANLMGAPNATPDQIAQAASLTDTTMPDWSSIEKPGDPGSFASRVLAIWQKEKGAQSDAE